MAKIWFGNVSHAQWVPAPATGMTRTLEGYTDEVSFTNGGLWIENSAAYHGVYEMSFPVQDSNSYTGIEAYNRYISGEYGTEFLRFVDPMAQDQNLFTEVWAAPALSERGWKRIYDTVPTYSATSANVYNKPERKAVFSVTSTTDAVPAGQNSVFTLLIPPTHTLHIGASGSSTGTAVLRVQPINPNGTNATPVDITLSADSAAPALTATFSGATYKAVRVYVTRTSSATSTITLTSLWAQIAVTGITPVISRHIVGKGHSGLRFRGNSRVETYVMASRHLVGAALTLAEVEPWQ